jgi:uroporphyrinogen-III synthase
VARRAATKKLEPARPRSLWVTRAQPGAAATAERLRSFGVEAVVEPLLEVRPVPHPALDLTDVSAIVFTSANAVAAFANACPERGFRVFAVGDATATAARKQRFSTVLSAQGNVTALAAALAARRRELTGPILYPAAAEPAQDLSAALAGVGLTVREAAVYETVAAAPSEALAERLPAIDGVLLHSAKATRLLAAYLKIHPAPHLVAYCLSRQVARPLSRAGLARVESAAQPNEAALLALVAPARPAPTLPPTRRRRV